MQDRQRQPVCSTVREGACPDNPCGPLPTVSVVIPAYNAAAVLGECLEAVRALEYPSEKLEILVIDNRSTDGTADAARRAGFEPLICEKRGASAARNAGIAHATGEIIAFTDSDAVPDPDWLLRLVEVFQDPAVGGVGGRIEAYRVVTGSETHAVMCHMLDQEMQLAGRPPYMLPFAATANAAFRASVLREAGGFDETLAICEDADLCWRVQWAGHKMLYVKDARVRHKHRSARREYFRQTYQYGKSTVDLFAKHRRRLGRRVWIEWKHYQRILRALVRAPIMPLVRKTGWDRVAPLYDLAAFSCWWAGRVVQSVRRGVLVI